MNVKRYNFKYGARNKSPLYEDPAGCMVSATDYDAAVTDLRAGICAAMSGDGEKADAILDKYWPDRPKLRPGNPAELLAVATGCATASDKP